MRDLTGACPDEDATERAKVAVDGWGARLLSLQGDDGKWAGGAYNPARYFQESDRYEGQPWTSTLPTLQLLWDFGKSEYRGRSAKCWTSRTSPRMDHALVRAAEFGPAHTGQSSERKTERYLAVRALVREGGLELSRLAV